MIADPIRRAEKWIEEQKDLQSIQQQHKLLEQKVQEQEKTIAFANGVLNSKRLLTTGDIAENFGMNASGLHSILYEKKIIYAVMNGKGNIKYWTPYYSYIFILQEEYADYHIHEYDQQLKWTGKGRKFIYERLLDMGYLI